MEDAIIDNDLEINYQSEASAGEKRKRDGNLRSKVWQHFTKILKEDGKCDKCQCNHCQKLFTCTSRSGTTHLLRHITDSICPAFKKDKSAIPISNYSSPRNNNGVRLSWKFDSPSSAQRCTENPNLESEPLGDYENPTPLSSRWGKIPVKPEWLNEFRSCVGKLVELANGKIPVGAGVAGPDYSISAALRCLNEMEDIGQTSEMYLDAFEILQYAGERECFVCLPPEPRRRWLQRVLHRRHPLRYDSNLM
ncbi:hypothetical protein CASFOL_024440 [Castilleja foliolosa]|uniref:BED-type domain-containing protein n=1 Tax=Castilleja foliolosa TaxID=1961234 RepID=A0ABD3CQ45_9LAMI